MVVGDSLEENIEEDTEELLEEEPGQNIRIEKKKLEEIEEELLKEAQIKERDRVKKDKNLER